MHDGFNYNSFRSLTSALLLEMAVMGLHGSMFSNPLKHRKLPLFVGP